MKYIQRIILARNQLTDVATPDDIQIKHLLFYNTDILQICLHVILFLGEILCLYRIIMTLFSSI